VNGTLVDSCVLLDLFTNDPHWADWSEQALAQSAARSTLFINAVIYSEISLSFQRIEDLDQTLNDMQIRVLEIPREALFLAAKVFLKYRRQGGHRSNVLPDFFIGAQALTDDLTLLTRDTKRLKNCFPGIRLLQPPAQAGSPVTRH